MTKLDVAQDASADNVVHTAAGTRARAALLIAGGALLGRLVPSLARKLMAVGTYIAATEVAGRRARARAYRQQRRRRGHQLGARLLPPFRRPPLAVRRPRELSGGRRPFDSARVLRKRIANVFRSSQRRAHRICLGRVRRHHAEPRAAFRPSRLRTRISCRACRATAWCSRAWPANWWRRPWPATPERFDVFARIPHREFPGGACFAGRRWCWRMLWFRLKDLL